MLFADIIRGGGFIQVSTKYKGLIISQDVQKIEECIKQNQSSDLFFTGGFEESIGLKRGSDSDVKIKNYFYVDIDVRKDNPSITDEELRGEFLKWTIDLLNTSDEFGLFRYIVCSGNGYQIYYMSNGGVPIFHGDAKSWAEAVRFFYERLSQFVNMTIPLDNSCVNISRIARCPGSNNCKTMPPKKAEVLFFQDRYYEEIHNFIKIGKKIVTEKEQEQFKKTEEIQTKFASNNGTTAYEQIVNIPIENVVSKFKGWAIEAYNGKIYFRAPGATRKSACYVQSGENFLVHGGTHEFSDFGQKGFNTFDFVRKVGGLSSKETFFWFKDNFHISGDKVESTIPANVVEIKESKSIQSVFNKLKQVDFSLLKLNNSLDNYDLFMRKIVCRIGALSFTGKSKIGYWLVHCLCKNGYNGYVFSTEVTSERVLAEFIHQVHPTSFDAKAVLRREVEISDEYLSIYRGLEIYDATDTDNSLSKIEAIIKFGYDRAIKNGEEPPAFCLIDFVQMISSIQKSSSEFHSASLYASEIQTIAQKYNICIIDLAQLNADGMKDTYAEQGFIPFLNSRALYANADIAIMLKRDRSGALTNNYTTFSIRKHKYGDPNEVVLKYSHKNGMFEEVELRK